MTPQIYSGFIPHKIKALRLALNYTQLTLAKQLGVSKSTVSSWECGTNEISHSNLKRLSHLLKLDLHKERTLAEITVEQEMEALVKLASNTSNPFIEMACKERLKNLSQIPIYK